MPNSHFGTFVPVHRFKDFFCQMTSCWMLWKTYYTLLLKKSLWLCPGPPIYLFERINWIISSFPPEISKILFDLGSWNNFGRLGSRIRDGPFHGYLTFETRSVLWPFDPLGYRGLIVRYFVSFSFFTKIMVRQIYFQWKVLLQCAWSSQIIPSF